MINRNRKPRCLRLALERLEDRCLLAFSVANADIFGNGSLRLLADFNQAVDASSVQASDLVIDGSEAATARSIVDDDTVEFSLPSLAAGTHTVEIAAGTILDSIGTGLAGFSQSFNYATTQQFTVKHNPRLQPGNAPLFGYPGSELDRVDILWQTIPAGSGTQDSFTVEYQPAGSTVPWQAAVLNAPIATGVENRAVRSASITGLNWNADYTYRVRHRRGDVIVAQYENTFHTRLAVGDTAPFTFAAYGDSATGSATGFRAVQQRINQNNLSFAVLLGDNVYSSGTHQESDSRFDPLVNPEAADWMATQIDYLGLGNHDVSTSSGLPSEQNYSVPVPVAGVTAPAAPPATERAEHSFSWDYGDVHFVTFDTNSLNDPTRLDGLLKWAVADLNASTARWKIVYGHHPLAGVPDKSEDPGDNYYQQVVNRLKAAGVDLFMTGHSHTYGWTYPLTGQINGAATYIDHGEDDHFHAGEGLPQLVLGVGGKEIRSGSFSAFPFVAEGFSSSTAIRGRLGFAQVSVTPNQLKVEYVAADNGAVIDSFSIGKDDAVRTTTFQQGVNGYAGTVDTFLHQNVPDTSNATAATLVVDNDDPPGSGRDAQVLLRFEDLFGGGSGQIPPDATIRSATLQLHVTNSGISINLHRMLASWANTDTWNSLSNGVQTSGSESLAAPDTSTGKMLLGMVSFNVLASLQAWQASPATNRGWVLLPTGSDDVILESSEGAVPPKLIVSYLPVPGSNEPPVAQNDTATTDTSILVVISVLGNDTDPNGDSVFVQSVTQPIHGITELNPENTVTYTPTTGYFGHDLFSYVISDGNGGTATATVSVTVLQNGAIPPPNSPPSPTDDTATTNEDTATTVQVLDNDSDPNGETLSVTSAGTPAHGTVVVVGGTTVTYSPAANYFGSDSFTYVINDGLGGSATGLVEVTVNAINDAPVANNDSAGTTGTSPVKTVVLANDTDVDGNALATTIVDNPVHGTVVVDGTGAVTYTANAVFAGTDTFTYKANDSAADSNLATVTVSVATLTKFVVVDSSADKIFRYQANGTNLSTAPLGSGNSNARGVATNADGSRLWVLDSNNKVYLYDAAQKLLGSWSPKSLSSPTGISVTGSDVWIVDRSNDRVYLYAGASNRVTGSASATRSFKLNSSNGSPQDLTSDGTNVWVTQSSSPDKVFVYRASNGDNLGSWTIDKANISPIGITLDPSGNSNSLWIVDDKTDRVYEYANGRTRLSGSQTASTSFALNSGNRNATGVADPHSEETDGPPSNADIQGYWSNPVNPLDVNGNGKIEPLDALNIINELNDPRFHDADGQLIDGVELAEFPGFFYDARPDGFVVPLDALVIINFLNSRNGVPEGEGAGVLIPARVTEGTTSSHFWSTLDNERPTRHATESATESRERIVPLSSRTANLIRDQISHVPRFRHVHDDALERDTSARGLEQLLDDLDILWIGDDNASG